MATLQSLEELEEYLRQVMPQWKSVQQLQRNQKYGFIDFKWNGHHFAVKPTLETFELKANNLYITAGSLLLHNALLTRTGNEQRIGAIVETMDKMNEILISHQQEGLALLGSVKATLQRLVMNRVKA